MGRYVPLLLFVVAGLAGWLLVLMMPSAETGEAATDPEPEAALAAPPIKLSKRIAPKESKAAPTPETAKQEAPEPPPPPPGDPAQMSKAQRMAHLKAMLKTPPHMLKSTRDERRKYFEHLLENQHSVLQRFQERVSEFEERSDLDEREDKELERARFSVTMFEESIEMLEEHLDDWED